MKIRMLTACVLTAGTLALAAPIAGAADQAPPPPEPDPEEESQGKHEHDLVECICETVGGDVVNTFVPNLCEGEVAVASPMK